MSAPAHCRLLILARWDPRRIPLTTADTLTGWQLETGAQGQIARGEAISNTTTPCPQKVICAVAVSQNLGRRKVMKEFQNSTHSHAVVLVVVDVVVVLRILLPAIYLSRPCQITVN